MYKIIDYNQLNTKQRQAYYATSDAVWPGFYQNSYYIQRYWNRLEQYFPQYQLFLIDEKTDEFVGQMSTIPIFLDRPYENLPDEGWDWLIEKGVEDFEQHQQANCLGGLQIVIDPKYRSHGLSSILLNRAKSLLDQYQFTHFILPIRPLKKHEYPDMDMYEYMKLKVDKKLYDPWIRIHLKHGAKIIKVCPKSMTIEGSIDFWKKWIRQPILSSQAYPVSGALTPVQIHLSMDLGIYQEPNIWIYYPR